MLRFCDNISRCLSYAQTVLGPSISNPSLPDFLRFAGLVDDETSAAFSGRDGSGVGNGVSSPAPSRFDDLVRSTGVPNPFPKRGNRRSKKRGPSYCVFCKNNGEKNQNADGAMER